MQVTNWPGICGLAGEKIDLYCAPLSKVLNYISTLFDEGLKYWTVNSYWSAISAYHNLINGEPIDTHPKVCALLIGIFNERLAQPRYALIWDADVVLTYMKNNISVACKLTVLLALSSALRA